MPRGNLLRQLGALHARLDGYRWAVPVLILLGIVGSLAESFGLSLIVLLLSLLLGGESLPGEGAMGKVFAFAFSLVGGSTTRLAWLIFGLILSKTVSGMIYGLLVSNMRHAVSSAVRAAIYRAYLTMPYRTMRRKDTGLLYDALTQHSWAVADGICTLVRMGTNMLGILIFTTFLLFLSWPATLVAMAGSIAIFALTAALGKPARRLGYSSLDANVTMTNRVLADLQGMRTIRAFAREEWAMRRFRAVSRRASSRFLQVDRLGVLIYPITEVCYLLLLGLVAWTSMASGYSSAATFAAILLLYRLQPHLREFESGRLALDGHAASVEIVQTMLDAQPRLDESPHALPYAGLGEGIVFDGVDFAYDNEHPVLREACFVIPSRGLTMLVGPSGSGKSTIINLLLRLYEPDAGRIFVGGRDLAAIARGDWLRHVAMAGQDSELFPGNVAWNVRLGRLNADLAAVREASAIAGIDEAISALTGGYGAQVGDRGLNLSGGQRQRVALARALVRDPDLLILDEATNSIERTLETRVIRDILAMRKDKATILVTHREIDLEVDATVIRPDSATTLALGI